MNQQEYDGKYILTSLDFLRQLLDYTTEVSAMELKLKPNVNTSSVQSKIENILGDDFVVQNRYQQQADVFRIMEIEKLISYLFLTFILMIACFNVIGSLSMLILDKKDDVVTLRSLELVINSSPEYSSLKDVLFLFWRYFRYCPRLNPMFYPTEIRYNFIGGRWRNFCCRRLSCQCSCLGYGTYFYHCFGSWIPFCMVSCTLFK